MLLNQPLIHATLLRRYKRFLADVRLESGELTTVHCANPGAMTGLDQPGMTIWLSRSTNLKRKLPLSWELAELPTGLVGINTALPNRIVAEALVEKRITEVMAYPNFRPEVKYGENSRVDFLLTGVGLPDCYLEVKNVHLSRTPELAEFPDAATARGAKHLVELAKMVATGHRAINLFLVQRDDCKAFHLAEDVDPAYANAMREARAAGVEVLAYDCTLSRKHITLNQPLPIHLPAG